MAPPQPTPPPKTPIFRTPDELLRDTFLRLTTAADLAHATAACPSFRRLIADHAFLGYRTLHPPPLIGAVGDATFIPAQPPHPSSVAARAFTGFDFSCSSFLPFTGGRTWRPLDFLDGRALIAGALVQEESSVLGLRHFRYRYHNLLVRDLAVCDPVHRRYTLLPAVPGDLKALVRERELSELETFLAPGDDEEDVLSFRVMCLVQCRMNILLVFSSSDGQWRSLPFYQWSAPEDELFDLPPVEDGLFDRQFVHGRFCWRLLFLNKLVLLDPRTMESSALNLPPQLGWGSEFAIVEAAQGMFGMLRKVQDRRSEDDDTYLLTYSSLRNNKWHLEKAIPLPVKGAALLSVGAGYLLIGAQPYTRSSHEKPKFELLSVDVKTLQIELFAELSEATLPDQLYIGFPPSLCAPTI
ncbi:LOW QUALITY PROTEIN: hypothetical protein CFC21_038420 [Triticum aestivum]|uniref:F-box domain-containing protein n=2 Tax=Triticum aestivum TaxID=4565 RepID=A0A3B6EQP8_WHEAT|nr:LOW QUALITY PROTEIN: hypothetical protein CFC21_038420 [Triticum aestivum]